MNIPNGRYEKSWRRAAAGLAISLLFALCVSPAFADAVKENADFDHNTTGFPLRGAHEKVPCESCHVRGILRGTPKLCRGCHERATDIEASKKPAQHIPTNLECDVCHLVDRRPGRWVPARMDHLGIVTGCAACHNGVSAPGKTANHIPTSAPCEDCHHSTLFFAGTRMDHTVVTGQRCASCHNGVYALGAPLGIPHTQLNPLPPCEICHQSTASFAVVRMDHTGAGIIDRCDRCHTQDRPPPGPPLFHPLIPADCHACHTRGFQSWKLF